MPKPANGTVLWTAERGWHNGPRVRVELDRATGRIVTLPAQDPAERYHRHGPSSDPYDVERRAMRAQDRDR
jgi:hypothetical protein